MTSLLKHIFALALICLATTANSQQAISVDENGTVTIPGQLVAGSVQAANLDATLKSIMEQNAQIIAQNQTIIDNQTWFVFANSLAETMDKIVADSSLLNQYEFRILRNGGPFLLKFSYWNRGLRAMTEPFMTADNQPYLLGGSMWVTNNTSDPSSQTCPAGQVYHRYYYYQSGSVQATGGNGCRAETAVYARKRPTK